MNFAIFKAFDKELIILAFEIVQNQKQSLETARKQQGLEVDSSFVKFGLLDKKLCHFST